MRTKLTALAFFTLIPACAFANWSLVAENTSSKAYLDTSSIKTVKIKVKEATIGFESKENLNNTILSEKVEFVCGSDAYRVFDNTNSHFKSISDKEEDRLIDKLYQETCKT